MFALLAVDGARGHFERPTAAPLASPSAAPGSVGGLLPDVALVTPGGTRLAARELRHERLAGNRRLPDGRQVVVLPPDVDPAVEHRRAEEPTRVLRRPLQRDRPAEVVEDEDHPPSAELIERIGEPANLTGLRVGEPPRMLRAPGSFLVLS